MAPRVIKSQHILAERFPLVIPESFLGTEAGASMDDLRARILELETLLEAQERDGQEAVETAIKETESALRSEVAEVVGRFESAVKQINVDRRTLLREAESEVIRLAIAVAGRIVHAHIKADEQVVRETVSRALTLAADRETIVVRVHPDDKHVIEEQRATWLAELESSRSLDIRADERIARGGCIVETESGNVDARIDEQLEVLASALQEKVQ